jgi:hypothetical protein
MPFRGESDAGVDHDGNDRYWEWVLRGQGTCHGYRGEEQPDRGQALIVFSGCGPSVHTIANRRNYPQLENGYCATFSIKIVRGMMQKNIGVIFLQQSND